MTWRYLPAYPNAIEEKDKATKNNFDFTHRSLSEKINAAIKTDWFNIAFHYEIKQDFYYAVARSHSHASY
jgi:hypothetical protein